MGGSRGGFEIKQHVRVRWLLVAAGVLFCFLALGIAAVQVWEYTNSVAFCTNTCHDVHPEEPAAYADSYHAQVKCTECHMGRVPVLEAVLLKATHARHLPAVLFDNYERPIESESMRPANESCERCHSASAWHDATAREIRRFEADEANTELRTYLLLNTGAAAASPNGGEGMHWHIGSRVEYIATDEHKQEIRWVRVSLPDGKTVEYDDALNPLKEEEIASAEKQIMDCVDCHNRVGHPFPSPEVLVDEALAEGRLSPDLPFLKREVLSILEAEYASQAEALAAADGLRSRYKALYPDLAATRYVQVDTAIQVVRDLVPRVVFQDASVSWQSFMENTGHRDDAGCFRCHDGKHVSTDGEAIRLQCTLCHSVPVTVGPGEEPPQLAIGERDQPDSHRSTHFVSDHRILADGTCIECHGEIGYGEDDSSFCANSACHSRSWPVVDLDALLAHPVRLEGGHAQATCDACHKGTTQVAYECAGCHDAPQRVHYGPSCEECHTAAGFAMASADSFEHPMALDGQHEGVGCASCHSTRGILTDECAACHTAPEDHLAGACESCHATVGWVESTLHSAARGGRIPHAVSSGDECAVCHALQADWPAPADHVSYEDEQCTPCHQLGGGPAVSGDHEWVSGLMQGAHADVGCASCHTDGVFQGTPDECRTCHEEDDAHDGQMGEMCAECHSPVGWERVSFNHSRTGFRLLGAHGAAACAECHVDGLYKGTPEKCVVCHGADEPRHGELGTDCARCHNTVDWRGATMDHALTGFLLTGAHVDASCAGCHGEGSYGGTSQDCAACHGGDEPHGGQLGQDCAACHTTSGWGGASIDHNLTSFPLTGAHASVGCTQCHAGGSYNATPTACAACHGEPGYHAGQLGTECSTCHTPDGWLPAGYGRAHTFPLNHRGADSTCRTCHPQSLGGYTCYTCHDAGDIGDEHSEEGIPNYQNCVACHPTGEGG